MTMLLWQRWVGSNGDVVVPAVSTQPSTHGGGMDTAVDTAVLSTVWPEGWTQLYSVLYGRRDGHSCTQYCMAEGWTQLWTQLYSVLYGRTAPG